MKKKLNIWCSDEDKEDLCCVTKNANFLITKYHFHFLLPPLLFTITQFKINTQRYWWLRSFSTKSIEGEQRYLTDMKESPQRLIKLICAFITVPRSLQQYLSTFQIFCHKFTICGVLKPPTWELWFLLQTQLRQEINKPLRRSNTFEPWQTHYCRLKTADDIC